MFPTDLKQHITKFASHIGLPLATIYLEGIVSHNTLYKWVREYSKKRIPAINYSTEQLVTEVKKYQTASGNYLARVADNKLILTSQQHYYDVERDMYADDIIADQIHANRLKYLGKDKEDLTDAEILRAFKISGIHIGYSHYSPLWLKAFIEEFKPIGIYDPCGGWGHRLIGALTSDIETYIYNDIWTKSYVGALQIDDFVRKTIPTNVETWFYNQDAAFFTPTEEYDTVFTCPPYYNTELYSSAFASLEEYNEFLISMLQSAITDKVQTVAITINKPYADMVIHAMPLKWALSKRILLGSTSLKSHLVKNSTKTEEILVFKRTHL